jgi:hypothetical protein
MKAQEWVEKRPGFWLYALRQLEDEANNATAKTGAKSAKTPFEVAWRVEVMRAQIPVRGPIPFLVACLDLATPCAPARCGSCGDSLEAGRRYRCAPCQEAAWLALNQVREDVPTGDAR